MKHLALLSLLLLSACSHIDHGQYAILSASDLKYDEYELINKNGYGEDKGIYWALYAGPMPQLDRAVNNALEKDGGLYMKNVKVHFESWIIPIIWGEFKMVVEGEIWGKKQNKLTTR